MGRDGEGRETERERRVEKDRKQLKHLNRWELGGCCWPRVSQGPWLVHCSHASVSGTQWRQEKHGGVRTLPVIFIATRTQQKEPHVPQDP